MPLINRDQFLVLSRRSSSLLQSASGQLRLHPRGAHAFDGELEELDVGADKVIGHGCSCLVPLMTSQLHDRASTKQDSANTTI